MLMLEVPIYLRPYFISDKPWEPLPRIKEIIDAIVKDYPGEYTELPGNKGVYVKGTPNIAPGAAIIGPALIGEGCQIRHGAFIRENVIIGDRCTIGNSTEVKNSILFDDVEVPHFNYVGDSIMGNKAHLGAGVKISNVLLSQYASVPDETSAVRKKTVCITMPNGERVDTGLEKFGAIIGDNAQVGCNSVLNPGTVLEPGVIVPPLSNIGGYFTKDFEFTRNIVYMKEGFHG